MRLPAILMYLDVPRLLAKKQATAVTIGMIKSSVIMIVYSFSSLSESVSMVSNDSFILYT